MNDKYSRRRSAAFIAGVMLGCGIHAAAGADDTEILTGTMLNPGNPNVLFIMDSSGSMASDVVVSKDYDASVTYTGDCPANRFYWRRETSGTVTLPDCASVNYVNDATFHCQTARRVISGSGTYRGQFAQWDATLEPASWQPVADGASTGQPNSADRLTECEADRGLHGNIDGDFYAADGADGPWATNDGVEIDWTSRDLYSFFSSNYLNWIQQSGAESTVSTRMQVLQRVVRNVMSRISGVRVGLMRFSTDGQGGMVLQEMVPIEQGRDQVIAAVESMSPGGGTPLAETLYEAALYYTGRPVDFGNNSFDSDGARPSIASSQDSNGNYISPIELQCQRNYVVLLTDGLPVSDTDANTRIEGLPGFATSQGSCSGNCLDELSKYLFDVDQRTDNALPDDQTVTTFTIGFRTDQELLSEAATGELPVLDADGNPVLDSDGNPVMRSGYFIADDEDDLARAFNEIIEAIQTDAESFTAPSLSVDVQNRLTNREDVYFAMFQPSTRGEPHWDGNLKKFRIGRPNGSGGSGTPTIVDANGRAAVDENGLFAQGAQSYWSLLPDETVAEGGFAGTLSTSRNIYSNITSGLLTAGSNAVHEDNGSLTAAMLGVADDQREALLQWARGLDSDGNARQVIGDPLHSQPTLVAYAGDNFALFFGTNDGFLHAIDPESRLRGETDIEHFAFIPSDLLPQLQDLRSNLPQQQFTARKAYGMDGDIRVWIDEQDNDRVVESGERAYLFAGMRRGGRDYYALDITDVTNPRLAWTIEGGSGDFAELGQTWSAPIVSRIRWDGSPKQVLFFAGGYDTNQDAKNRPTSDDDMGRAIYMVDALTGERLWWASIREEADLTLEDMTHSIPSDLRVIDTNQDGFDDRIYVGDTRARVWRFDIDNSDSTITGTVFAELGGGGEAGNRRIYSAPSVTRIIDENFGSFLTVSVGTGHRAHPLEADVRDGFFMMRDLNVFAAPVDPSTQQVRYPDPIRPNDLLDVTDNVTPGVDDLDTRKGWLIEFDSAEKSLSAPLTVLDRIFFTTYVPGSFQPTCKPTSVLGSGRLYTVDILSGSPLNYNTDTPAPGDRYDELGSPGIPPTPALVFTPPPCDDCDAGDQPVSEITLLVGTEAIDPIIDNRPRRTYWVQEEVDR
ncbi:MAG: PQQ-binding-like beta-propeller repeat protein [Gammaproteobacteria bacterium]|nr:PQQ-binding-like beta-propeller repeat protein [Gammaproteobacteria bacterium]